MAWVLEIACVLLKQVTLKSFNRDMSCQLFHWIEPKKFQKKFCDAGSVMLMWTKIISTAVFVCRSFLILLVDVSYFKSRQLHHILSIILYLFTEMFYNVVWTLNCCFIRQLWAVTQHILFIFTLIILFWVTARIGLDAILLKKKKLYVFCLSVAL